jgi:hypothetical protein
MNGKEQAIGLHVRQPRAVRAVNSKVTCCHGLGSVDRGAGGRRRWVAARFARWLRESSRLDWWKADRLESGVFWFREATGRCDLPAQKVRSRLDGARLRAHLSSWILLSLFLHAACAPGAHGHRAEMNAHWSPAPPAERITLVSEAEGESATVYALEWMEPLHSTRPVAISRADFLSAVQRLSRHARPAGSPREAASEWMKLPRRASQEVETVTMTGLWLLEGSPERTSSFVPLSQTGPVSLTPAADEALRVKYLAWCGHRGGGDCLGLLDDGPFLRADDRRTLALALAFGSVLDEMRGALAHELLDARALVATVVWSVALYCTLWMVPEPTTKAVAASLTVALVAWLGLDTVWGLMEGWARMAQAASEATTFEELRAAGGQFGHVLGEDAARAMILAVSALTGRSLGEVASRVRSLPGYGLAGVQWEAQGGMAALGSSAVRQEALAAAVGTVEAVAVSASAPLSLVLLKKGMGGAGARPGARGSATVLRHRAGNQQVELANGQRWHLPRGKSVADIPTQDSVGDQLQEAVTQAARDWGPDKLSPKERGAIQDALGRGKYWLARLLEREARGRAVEDKVRTQFQHLFEFSRNKGVDVIDPGTGLQYEILTGSEANLARHGRRMAGEFFRMLTF